MAQRIFKQPQRGGSKREYEPESLVGPTFNPGERLGGIRERSQDAGDTSNIDDALRQAEEQPFNPADGRSYTPQSIARAERNRRAAAGKLAAGRTQVPVSLKDQENKTRLGNAQDMYKKSKKNRAAGGRRGLFIGLGAGGGILSIVSGFMFMLPFKLPGIMDGLIDNAGDRVEKIIMNRGEKVLMRYVIQGSFPAVANGTVIATGNPLGDLFANMRTAKFEEKLLNKHGIKLEPTPDKRVRFVYKGNNLGDFRNAEELQKYLNRDDLNTAEIRRVFKLIVRDDISGWRWLKRAKLVAWLRLKYAINKWGVREKKADEKMEDYRKNVRKEHIEVNARASIGNLIDFSECATGSTSCKDVNKAGGAQDLQKKVDEVLESATNDLSNTVGQKITNNFMKTLIQKIQQSAAGKAVPYLGQFDMLARFLYHMDEIVNNDLLQKKHAQYVKASSGVLAATYAGYGDQVKAGDMPSEVVGDFADMFNGMEESRTYDVVNNGDGSKGTDLPAMEKIQEDAAPLAFAQEAKDLFNMSTATGRPIVTLWYNTVSRALDAVGDLGLDALEWIAKYSPAGILIEEFTPYIADVLTKLFTYLGLIIDPLAEGLKLYAYVHMGWVGIFNDYAKDIGMRYLTHAQAAQVSQHDAAERAKELKYMSAGERLFDFENQDSLAYTLLQRVPRGDSIADVSKVAFMGADLVASLPSNAANAVSSRTHAATYVNLYGEKVYGALPDDLATPLHPNVEQATEDCPENSDNAFNHCSVDRKTVESFNCEFVKCADVYQPVAQEEEQTDSLPNGDIKSLAEQLMQQIKQGRVEFEPGSGDGAKSDIERMARGESTTNTCNSNKTYIDQRVLAVLVKLTENYSYRINSLSSDHHCNQGYHPRGQAADLGWVNGKRAINDVAFYRDFVTYLGSIVPKGTEIGQKNCLGNLNFPPGSNIDYIPDTCNHVHFGVPNP